MTESLQRCLPDDAFAWIDQWSALIDPESRPASEALHQRLADPVFAQEDIPSTPQAAVNGFAVQAASTEGASDYSPLPLTLVAHGSVTATTALAVSSGEPLPSGADAVLPLEQANRMATLLEVVTSVAPGEGLIHPGEECQAGECLLEAGHGLRPVDLVWLSLGSVTQLRVQRRPRVRLLLAGSFQQELNTQSLVPLLQRDGGELLEIRRTPTPGALHLALQDPGADVQLVIGGSGLGTDDFAVPVLRQHGQVAHHGVAIHPGDSVALGQCDGTPVMVLPGAPLACLCAYDLLACRLLRRLAGYHTLWPYPGEVLPLKAKISSHLGRLEICRVRRVVGGVEPLAISEARLLRSLATADGLVLVPVQSEGFAAGSEVTVYRF